MKRYFVLILVLSFLALALVACNGADITKLGADEESSPGNGDPLPLPATASPTLDFSTPVPIVPVTATPSLASDPTANFWGIGPGEGKTVQEGDLAAISIILRSMKRNENEVRLCLGFTNNGKERVEIDLRSFKALDQYEVPGRWGELLEPAEGYQLALEPEPQTHTRHQALDFRFPEPPEAVELRLASAEDHVVAVWDLDLVPRVREIRIHYKTRGHDPPLGVAIPVGEAPPIGSSSGVGLVVNLGDTVNLMVENGTTEERDFTLDGLDIQSPPLKYTHEQGQWKHSFKAETAGRFTFYDSLDPYQSIRGTLAIYAPPDQGEDCG